MGGLLCAQALWAPSLLIFSRPYKTAAIVNFTDGETEVTLSEVGKPACLGLSPDS